MERSVCVGEWEGVWRVYLVGPPAAAAVRLMTRMRAWNGSRDTSPRDCTCTVSYPLGIEPGAHLPPEGFITMVGTTRAWRRQTRFKPSSGDQQLIMNRKVYVTFLSAIGVGLYHWGQNLGPPGPQSRLIMTTKPPLLILIGSPATQVGY